MPLPLLLKAIDAQAILTRIDLFLKLVDEQRQLGRIDDALEHRELHALTKPFADLGYTPQPATPRCGLRLHVVGNEYLHSAAYRER